VISAGGRGLVVAAWEALRDNQHTIQVEIVEPAQVGD
jgi:hypothetical protein